MQSTVINSSKELQLKPWQINWANRAFNILLNNHGYIDTSRMRSGKTYVTLWLAKKFNIRLLIICPLIVIDVWRRTAEEYGIQVVDIINYESLRSVKDHQPKHGYLHRYDNITEGGRQQVTFVETQKFKDLREEGIFLICDEAQNIRNNSDQYKACNGLIQPIVMNGGRSRFGLLSGTPFDKEEQSLNILRLIGYIRAHKLYNTHDKKLILDGVKELIDACRFINKQETEKILIEIPITKSKINHLCYILYVRVVKASISGAMSAPTNIEGILDTKNGFFNISNDNMIQLKNAIGDLANAVYYNDRTGTVGNYHNNMGKVTDALVQIENLKINDIARVANNILIENKTAKLVISLNYTSTINGLKLLLSFYNPLVLNGDIHGSEKKNAVVGQFNYDPSKRLLLMNTAAGGVGISLYSQYENSPRYMLISPSYHLLNITQAAARIYGPGMKSNAYIRIFYGRGDAARETSILNSLALKSKVLEGTLEDSVTNDRDFILPGDYPSIEELN